MSSKANYFFKNLFRYSFLLLDFITFVWWHLLLSQSISHGWSCNNSGIFRTIQKLSVWSRYCAGQAESCTKNLRFVCHYPKGCKTKILMGNWTVFLSASLQGRGKRKESHSFCQNQDFQDSGIFRIFNTEWWCQSLSNIAQ